MSAPVFGVCGVPKSLGEERDYDKIFRAFNAAGVSMFFATFQFQEVPTGLSLGFETDFLPPCKATAKAFVALKAHGIKLIVPGELLYAREGELPPLAEDPLRQLLACTGDDGIYGVLTYDEPSHTGATDAQLKRLYDRVKMIKEGLPVLMVHAPLTADQSPAEQSEYMTLVAKQSTLADIVGFDVYAVPRSVANMPSADGTFSDNPAETVASYVAWMKQAAPTKQHLIVLQGHSIANLYSAEERMRVPREIVDRVRPPSKQETQDMTRRALDGGATVVVWWGPSFVPRDTMEPWCSILGTVAEQTNNSFSRTCVANSDSASSTTSLQFTLALLLLLLLQL
jgi:hypothetical protein